MRQLDVFLTNFLHFLVKWPQYFGIPAVDPLACMLGQILTNEGPKTPFADGPQRQE
jgi:hypothetical protein